LLWRVTKTSQLSFMPRVLWSGSLSTPIIFLPSWVYALS
jgi:hypothetical protein